VADASRTHTRTTSAHATFLRCDPSELRGCLHRLPFAEHLGIRVPGLVDRATAARWADAVEAAEALWTADFDGEQHCLGRAYYTHLEEDKLDDYFEDAAATDARVEAVVPGLQDFLRAVVARLTDREVTQRERFCGAGVHVFSPGKWVAHNGGDVHFDTEGLDDEGRAARVPALTLVLMLRPAQTGGGLRVWTVLDPGTDVVTRAMIAKPSELVDYEVGELLILDSYRLHQIQPFQGETRRISATLHGVERADGSWETWF
jgi:hypothetical protein